MKSEPQQTRSRETVERLLAAASSEFARHGVTGTTTTSIAELAGVSVGSLYRFFGDKEAMAAALSDRYLESATERYGEIINGIKTVDDLVPALRQIVGMAAELQLDHPGYYRITEDNLPDLPSSPANEVRQSLVEYFSLVLDGFDVGESPAQRRQTVSLLTETIRHTLARHGPDSPDRDEQLAELEHLAVGYLSLRFGLNP